MCVAIWASDEHPIYKLLLVHNRDELYSRETYPIHWWQDEQLTTILAGRDGKEGGTWLGLSSTGRLAFVTNLREPRQKQRAVSRGHLPLQFLLSSTQPQDHITELIPEAGDYNGFNLLVADLNSGKMACYSHSLSKDGDKLVYEIPEGVEGVSNGFYQSRWPKVEAGKQKLRSLLNRYPNQEIPESVLVEELLQDRTMYDARELPKTGVTPERERELSPLFVSIDSEQVHYGTMSMTVVAVRRSGLVSVYEKYADEKSDWKDHRLEFMLPSSSNSS